MAILSVDDVRAIGTSEMLDTVGEGFDIANLTHPNYRTMFDDWEKWRLTYEGGDKYIDEYLQKFSEREDDEDFEDRKDFTYVPAFAKSAVNEIKNAIFQRIADVTREGGTQSYQDAVKGENGGIDLAGTTMNSFMGTNILPELLTMKKVGVFVDMPQLGGETLQDQMGIRPYMYHYVTENILNWEVSTKDRTRFSKLLLRDMIYTTDEATGLPKDKKFQYRYMWVRGNYVLTQFFNTDSVPIDRFGEEGIDVIVLNLPSIPFVLFEISDSLLKDICNYQIALLNLASSDIAYALFANFPFYVEQFDPRVDNLYRRAAGHTRVGTGEDSVTIVQAGEREDAIAAKNYEIEVGATTGRRIPKGLDMPMYIHPSSEPLRASMAKQDELKKDIRMLCHLALSNLTPKMASAESKDYDERGLEAGLSAIGLELAHGERQIAAFWQQYVDPGQKAPTVNYPQKYSLQSDKDRRDEAKDLLQAARQVPSVLYKREALKQVAAITVGTKVSLETLNTIKNEIENADVVINPEELERDIELGLIDLEAASKAKGYPEGSVDKAKTDHAERVARIAESQAKARGADDLGGIEKTSRDEKMVKDMDEVPAPKTRGEAK